MCDTQVKSKLSLRRKAGVVERVLLFQFNESDNVKGHVFLVQQSCQKKPDPPQNFIEIDRE